MVFLVLLLEVVWGSYNLPYCWVALVVVMVTVIALCETTMKQKKKMTDFAVLGHDQLYVKMMTL